MPGWSEKMSGESLRSGPHPHVLSERSGIDVGVGNGLSSVQVAFVIDGDELPSVYVVKSIRTNAPVS